MVKSPPPGIPREPEKHHLQNMLPDRWMVDQFVNNGSKDTPEGLVTYRGTVSRDLIQQTPGEIVIRFFSSVSKALPDMATDNFGNVIPDFDPPRTVINTRRTDQEWDQHPASGFVVADTSNEFVVLVHALTRYIDIEGPEVPLSESKQHVMDNYAMWVPR